MKALDCLQLGGVSGCGVGSEHVCQPHPNRGQPDVERKRGMELTASKRRSGWGYGNIMSRRQRLSESLRAPTGLE